MAASESFSPLVASDADLDQAYVEEERIQLFFD